MLLTLRLNASSPKRHPVQVKLYTLLKILDHTLFSDTYPQRPNKGVP